MSRGRAPRLVVLVAVVLAALAASGFLALPEIVRRLVVWKLGASTSRVVTLARTDVGLTDGRVALHGLRIMDRDGRPLVTVDRLELQLSLRDLLRGHLRVTHATLHSPTLRVVRTGPRAFNLSDLFSGEAAAAPALALTIEQFELVDGTADIEDRTLAPPRVWRLEAIALQARDLSTRAAKAPGIVTASTIVAGSPVALWVTDVRLRPFSFRVTANARQIDASLLGLYLPPDSPLSPSRGVVNVSGTVERGAAGSTRIALDAVLDGIELRRPEQDNAYLSAPSIRVQVDDLRLGAGGVGVARLAVDGAAVALEDTRLTPLRRWHANDVALEVLNLSSARGSPAGVASVRALVAGSPVSVWVSDLRLAPLELHAIAVLREVDVTLLRLYLPPDLPLRAERGVVNASVRVAHDAEHGTRLALDAGLRDVELRRPSHLVTAPVLRLTGADIAFGRDAVTIGRAELHGDRLTVQDRTLSPPRTWQVRNLDVEATGLSSRREDLQGVATARATIEDASISVWLTRLRLNPLELHATTILRDVDLALSRLYLPTGTPVVPERGSVNASLQVEHTEARGTRLDADILVTGVAARGPGPDGPLVTAPSLRLTLADARRDGKEIRVGRFELGGRGVLSDRRAPATTVDVDRLRVSGEALGWPTRAPARIDASVRLADASEVDASGTVEITAPPPDLRWRANLRVRLETFPLGQLAAWAPVVDGLRGRVRGDVTTSVAYAGALTARVRGDVEASPFVVRDGERRILSVRRAQAGGLDVEWPERVAVARLRLEEPHALVERDRQGRFALAARLAPRVGPAASPAADMTPPSSPRLAIDEFVVDRGSLVVTDESAALPRLEVPRVDLTLRSVTWPSRSPARLTLDATLPDGGSLKAEGTVGGEPVSVDLRLILGGADLGLLQPYLDVPAHVAGRVDATLALAGPLAPTLRLSVRGDVGLSGLTIADGRRDLITVARLDATGVDATWPGRVAIDQVRMRGSWALIERDPHQGFVLRALFERPHGSESATAGVALQLRLREALFEDGAAVIVDGTTTPSARFDVAGARLVVRDFSWPASSPVRLQLSSPTPMGGKLDFDGTLALEPMRLEGRAILDGVDLRPAQPYLPIAAQATGRVSGDVTVTLGLEPLTVQLRGDARVRAFRLSDGGRPLATVGRAEALGIDVAWPGRVVLDSVRLRQPRLLIERDARGDILLRRLLTPRWTTPPAGIPAAGQGPSGSTRLEVGTLTVERASARFVDHTTTPAFVEELSGVDVALTGFETATGRRAQVKASGALPGGASFTLGGELALGAQLVLDLTMDLRDYLVPRANPYLERLTSWTASRGRLSLSASYTLADSRLDAQHDVLLRGLEVEAPEEDDEVERRLGLPLGFLLALMKDARGELRLSVPVSGDLSTGEFDFGETMWAAVRNLAIRLLALPFARVGSLFFSEDSKVQGVAIDPVHFEAGAAHLGHGMGAHLERVAAFLKDTPSVRAVLAPILTAADVDALGRRTAGAPATPETLRELAARRLEVVRQTLTGHGVAPERLTAPTRRVPLVEAAGTGRVELDLRP